MTAGEGGTATAAGDAAAVEARSLTVSLWANLFMAVTGILAAWLSHSDAVLIDGLYSAVNFAAAIVARRVGASVARRPDRSRPFGYDADEAAHGAVAARLRGGAGCAVLHSHDIQEPGR